MKCTQVLIKEPKKRNKRKNPVISKTHNNEFEVAPYIPPFMRGGSVAINSTARLPLVPRPRCLDTLKIDKSKFNISRTYITSEDGYNLICDSNNLIKCRNIHCNIIKISAFSTVLIRFITRFYNHTVQKMFPKYQKVFLNVDVDVLYQNNSIFEIRANTNVIRIILQLLIKETLWTIPLWVITLSSVIGIVLLLIIVFVLWKCNYFRRNKNTFFIEENQLIKD
ncbi:hypothetical protein A3Q56_00203 [Intoshia linei]|uniref:Integrin alpha third immunoglobulin-like domain-containing protein n=1 Tax=Intoshia linei TaxID=1819745 RepID=A0A177BE85_9BILA|nr:hypothetical protein A3Q56_00203 [Intoshia linei]